MPEEIDYLFRGTTRGFDKGIFIRAGYCSASVDPAIATLFAMTSSGFGEPVVHTFRPSDVAGEVKDLRGIDKLKTAEAEFAVHVPPRDVERVSLTISAQAAVAILANLGIRMPLAIYNVTDISRSLPFITRLDAGQRAAFVSEARRIPT